MGTISNITNSFGILSSGTILDKVNSIPESALPATFTIKSTYTPSDTPLSGAYEYNVIVTGSDVRRTVKASLYSSSLRLYERDVFNGSWLADWRLYPTVTSAHYTGNIFNDESSSMYGTGKASFFVTGNLVRVEFGFTIINGPSPVDRYSGFGINRDFFTSSIGTITPLDGGFWEPVGLSDSFAKTVKGRWPRFRRDGQFWMFDRVYDDAGNVGVWGSNSSMFNSSVAYYGCCWGELNLR